MVDSEYAAQWTSVMMRRTLAEAAYEAGILHERAGDSFRAREWLQTAHDHGSPIALEHLDRLGNHNEPKVPPLRLVTELPPRPSPGLAAWRHLLLYPRGGRRAAAGTTILAAVYVLLTQADDPAVAVQLAQYFSGFFVAATGIWVVFRNHLVRGARRLVAGTASWRTLRSVTDSNTQVAAPPDSTAVPNERHIVQVKGTCMPTWTAPQSLTIIRRLGVSPKPRRCDTDLTCPDIFELTNGNFAVIGTDVTDLLRLMLPADAGCASYERIVELPREILVDARSYIPLA